jgi:hypothetical protein
VAEHTLFYYPYASLTNAQLPLLKVAVLYFDKLVILDPVGASWNSIGADHFARDAVKLLADEQILKVVTPGEVLAKYGAAMAAAIRRDMADHEFVELCDAHAQATGKQTWTLSLAKMPKDLTTDQAMRQLMGDVARKALADAMPSRTASADYVHYGETEIAEILEQAARLNALRPQPPEIPVYDEYREGYDGGGVEYRYAQFPLALGESIMMNHALFTGLLYSNATPITDDPFHSHALMHKLRRATKEPVARQAMLDLASQRQIKAGELAATALQDKGLKLPILHPAVPLEEVLAYRKSNPHSLAKVRDALGQMARRIQAEPWTKDFQQEIETKTIPDLVDDLREAEKSRDAWTHTQRMKTVLRVGGIASAVGAVALGLIATPAAPVAWAIGGLGLTAEGVFPVADWLLDKSQGTTTQQENGLHYLLNT